jgi:hypothetical protein
VAEHGEGLVAGQAAVKQVRPFALGEGGLTGAAVEQAVLLLGAVAAADGKVTAAALAVVRAVRVLAAEGTQVVNGCIREPGTGRVIVEVTQLVEKVGG